MRRTVHLRFSVDVESESEAWDIADRLESAALARNYVAISAWVEAPEGGRSGVLSPEGTEAVTSTAETIERVSNAVPTGVGIDGEKPLGPSRPGEDF